MPKQTIAIRDAKIWQLNKSAYVLTIPKSYIDNLLLNTGKAYHVRFDEEKNAKQPIQ